MKNVKLVLAMFMALFVVVAACESDDDVVVEDTFGEVGNWWSMYVDGTDLGDVTIINNEEGNFEARFDYNGSTHFVEGKITENGISDYVYSNGDRSKPFTLVKFDASVGDKWTFNVGDKQVVREVVRKSETDDVEYGFFLIKTIDVEETIPVGTMINGGESQVKKILWKFNHKFGFIEADITEADNTVTRVTSITNAADFEF
jgi:hypothetical protein